ncbi:MAG: hypothetical protein GY801_23055 [bacterium]|nr:hypothetical protein [bacterium]
MMDGEDEILEALEDLGRNIARNDEIIEEQDKALEEKERQIEALRKRLNNSSS